MKIVKQKLALTVSIVKGGRNFAGSMKWGLIGFEKLKQLVPSPVKVLLRKTEVLEVLCSFSTETSRKDSFLSESIS